MLIGSDSRHRPELAELPIGVAATSFGDGTIQRAVAVPMHPTANSGRVNSLPSRESDQTNSLNLQNHDPILHAWALVHERAAC